jgi:hypothetical protein
VTYCHCRGHSDAGDDGGREGGAGGEGGEEGTEEETVMERLILLANRKGSFVTKQMCFVLF